MKMGLKIVSTMVALLLLFSVVSCRLKFAADKDFTMYNEFENATDQVVTLRMLYLQNADEVKGVVDESRTQTHVIQPGDKASISYLNTGHYDVSVLRTSSFKPDSVVVDNGVTSVSYQSPERDTNHPRVYNIYDLKLYELVHSDSSTATYKFTFDDMYFVGGEPL